MNKGVYLILILMLVLFPVISSITGEVSQSPTNVSVLVQPGPPVIYIHNPQNTSYSDTNLLFNYSIRNNISQSWYSLDNGNNITLGNSTENSILITTTEGSHLLTLYANNTIGQSVKDVSFTISSQEQPPPGPGPGGSGGGGGGSGSGSSSITAFDLEKNLLQVSLIQGETKTERLKVKNIGSSKITISITTDSLEDFVLIEEKNLTINPGETQELEVHFFALESKLPNIYFGKITFTSGNINKSIVAVIELKQRQALFDINVEILSNYKTVPPGRKISSIIDLTNIGLRGTAVDVELTLYLTDEEKNKISEVSQEVLAVKDNLTITRKLQVPNNIQSGTYFLIVDLKYGNITASSYDSFRVNLEKTNNLWWIILLIILILILCIIIIKVIYHHEEKKTRHFTSQLRKKREIN